jgi:hypothetical protein
VPFKKNRQKDRQYERATEPKLASDQAKPFDESINYRIVRIV